MPAVGRYRVLPEKLLRGDAALGLDVAAHDRDGLLRRLHDGRYWASRWHRGRDLRRRYPTGRRACPWRNVGPPVSSIRAAMTSESLTKTFLFFASCRSSDQYSSRAAASEGTRAVGRWSITIRNSGIWSATPAIARMRLEIGIRTVQHQAALGQHLQPSQKFRFLRVDGQIAIPKIAVPNAQKQRVGVKPIKLLLIVRAFLESGRQPCPR